MGGNILANALGEEGEESILEAACILVAPHRLYEVAGNLLTALNGFYDKAFGKYMIDSVLEHLYIYDDYFK